MPTGEHVPAPELLLAHRDFLRSLVRSLLRGDGAGDADDVVQETLLRAASAPRPRAAHVRTWLGAIARNLTFDHLRAARRRERLYAVLPRPDAVPSPDEVLHHEQQRQRVVAAVLALPEPYRTPVLLRYWEGVSPAAIARRVGVPAATVRSWLQRGLRMLRERLDREYGGRPAWLAALAPFATPATIGALLMTKAKYTVTFASLLLVGLLGWTWWRAAPAMDPPPATHSGAAGPIVAVASAPGAVASRPPDEVATRAAAAAADAPGQLTLTGQVRRRGVPYADAAVSLRWFAGYEADGAVLAQHAVACDRDGRFTWRGPRRDAVATVVAVTPDQPLRTSCTPVAVEPDDASAELDVEVTPLDCVLHGRVHDRGGAPIAGARLAVNLWRETETTTGPDGAYEMRVPTEAWPLLVSAPGRRNRLLEGYVPTGATRHALDIELEPGEQRVGRVVDAHGAAVAGATVRASGLPRPIETDADGRFTLDGLAPGSRHRVTAAKAGFQRAETMTGSSRDPLELVLQPGVAVVVRVVTPAGAPVGGAVVRVGADTMQPPARKGVSGPDGRLRLDDLGTRAVRVVVEKAGSPATWVQVEPASTNGEVPIVLRPGFGLRGTVFDGNGAPLAGASVYCEREQGVGVERAVGSRATTGPDGRFELRGVPGEPCIVYAFHAENERGSVSFQGGALADTVLRLVPAPGVAGRVLDAATGAPIAAFTVTLTATGKTPMRPLSLTCADAGGRWRARHAQLRPGAELAIEVRAPGYAPGAATAVATAAPPDDQTVVQLVRGARVEGTVCDAASGAPIAGVTVRCGAGAATTDAAGRFVLANVAAGEQQAALEHRDHLPTTVPFEVAAGRDVVVVELRLPRGVAVRGRVDGAGAGTALTLLATGDDLRTIDAQVRDDRTFELLGVRPGELRVMVREGSGRAFVRRLTVGNADVDGVVLARAAGPATLRATVLVRGVAVADGTLMVTPAGGGDTEFASITNGTAAVEGLPPGRYRVTASGRNAASGAADVEVGAGETAITVSCEPRR
jgi:RNA polymerase sigma-70 factor (ECF subfamily)